MYLSLEKCVDIMCRGKKTANQDVRYMWFISYRILKISDVNASVHPTETFRVRSTSKMFLSKTGMLSDVSLHFHVILVYSLLMLFAFLLSVLVTVSM